MLSHLVGSASTALVQGSPHWLLRYQLLLGVLEFSFPGNFLLPVWLVFAVVWLMLQGVDP